MTRRIAALGCCIFLSLAASAPSMAQGKAHIGWGTNPGSSASTFSIDMLNDAVYAARVKAGKSASETISNSYNNYAIGTLNSITNYGDGTISGVDQSGTNNGSVKNDGTISVH